MVSDSVVDLERIGAISGDHKKSKGIRYLVAADWHAPCAPAVNDLLCLYAVPPVIPVQGTINFRYSAYHLCWVSTQHDFVFLTSGLEET